MTNTPFRIHTEPFCSACCGHHIPDSDETYVVYQGYRFPRPFRCMCCGKEICARQFAWGRCCGPCDTGTCQTGNREFRIPAAHPHPPWWDYDGKAMFRKFVEAVGAIREER